MRQVVRLIRLEIENIKNVQHGELEFAQVIKAVFLEFMGRMAQEKQL